MGGARLHDAALRAEREVNENVRDQWDAYAGHRARVTATIAAHAPRDRRGRLVLLGAGNANDVDLDALAALFCEIHLVDLDAAAVARSVARATPSTREALVSHAPLDLSGLYRTIDAAGARVTAPGYLDAQLAPATDALLRVLPRGLDVVASCCALTQMALPLERHARGDGALLGLLEQALVTIHLRTLLGLCAPGGTAILFTDVASSDLYPLDPAATPEALKVLLDDLTDRRIVFRVSNAVYLRRLLRRDPDLAATCGATELSLPWLWEGPHDVRYLVHALTLRRA